MATTTSPATKTTVDSAKTLSNKGTVAQVIGEVKVITASGETRLLQVGDKIGAGDTIQTGADGAVAITFDNGANINLGHADTLTFTSQMLADLLKPANNAADDAARIQELIAQGADPTQVAAASAAGAGGGEDGGHSFVVLDNPNSRVDINSSFLTEGISQSFESPTLEPPTFVVTAEPVIFVPDDNGIEAGNKTIVENSATPATGFFNIQADAGIVSITVNGIVISLAQLNALATTPLSVSTQFGTLTLTGFDAVSGNVSYSYAVEAGGQNHSAGDTSVQDLFTISLTDGAEQTVSATLDVLITDTTPLAVNDGIFTLDEDGTSNAVSGNVLSNDIASADTPNTFVSWSAADAATVAALNAYGTLVQGADGSWSFTLNNALATTQALSAADHPSFTLNYTMQDADGDQSSAQLTITLNGGDDTATVSSSIEGPDVTVFERGLISTADDSETASGAFSFTATDGLSNLVVGGVSFTLAQLQSASVATPLTVNTGEGTLLITGYTGSSFAGSVSYSYTLLAPIDNVGGAANESFTDTVAITVNGIGGTTASGTLNMVIVDDHPVAVNDGPFVLSEDDFGGEGSDGPLVSGNVLTNDAANADTPKSFVEWAAGDASTIASLNTYGTLVQNGDGSWSYTLNNALAATQALSVADHPSFTLHYTMQDADGDQSSAELTITINGTNDRPEIHFLQGSGSAVVSEEALSNALIDDVLLNDPTDLGSDPADAVGNPKTSSGSFTVSDVDLGDTLTVSLSLPALPALASNGAPVSWSLSLDGHTATAYLGSDPTDAANKVLTVTLTQQGTSNTWDYQVELFKPVDHPANSYEDLLNLNLGINVSDSTTSSTGNLSITIEDDMPVAAAPQTISQNLPAQIATNLVLTLDVSGSMGDPSGDGIHTRLELAQLALTQLIDQYDNLGDVKVMLVAFSGNASVQGTSTWLDAATAKSLLAALNANGSTNYDIGLQQVMDHFGDAGKLIGTNVQNVSYFLSDGEPTDSDHLTYGSPDTGTNPSSNSVGIVDDDIADWQQFLTDNNVNALSFGMGTGADTNALNPIAYNGSTGTDTNAVAVPTLSALPDVLISSVLTPIAFSLMPTGSGFGADGGHIASVVVDGHTFGFDGTVDGSAVFASTLGSFNAGTHVWTINSNGTTAAGGTIVVDMNTGAGSYNVSATSSLIETLHYNLIDNDGDGASGDLTFHLNAPPTITIDTGNQGNANDVVFESGIDSVGSDPGSNAELASGSFTIGDPNDLSDVVSVIINGGAAILLSNLAGTQLDSPNGTLTILTFDAGTGVATYQFELKTPTTNLPGVEANSFTLESVDAGGVHSTPQTLTFEIINDTPTALADVDSVTATSSVIATGNVVTGISALPEGATGAATDGAADVLGADRLVGDAYVVGVAVGSPSGPLTGLVGSTLFGTYGSLSLASNGEYTYTLYSASDTAHSSGYNAVLALDSSDAPLLDTFSYTIKDADNDSSTTTLKITINGSNEGSTVTVNQDGIGDQVFESALSTGSNPGSNGEFATGHFTIADPDGLDDIKGIQVVSNGVTLNFTDAQLEAITANPASWLSFNTANGTVTLNSYNTSTGSVGYQFELKTPTTDAAGSETNDFTVAATDDGSTYSAAVNISIEILDDIPSAAPNFGSVSEDGVLIASGNVLNNDSSGADTPASFVAWGSPTISSGSIADYGDLVLNPSTGVYTFTLNNTLPAVQALQASDHVSIQVGYTMQDADGDQALSTLTITINGADDRATVTTSAQGPDVIVYEHGLTSAPDTSETATNSFSFSVSDGLNTLTVGGTAFTLAQLQGASVATPLSVNTGEGTLLITGYAGNSFGGAVSYSYTLLAPINNTGGAANESFLDTVTVTVSGIGGTTANGTLNMSIIDDHPLASNDGPFAVTEDAVSNVVSGNVLDNDTANADTPKAFVGWSGADAATIATLNSYGTLVQGASGTWSFTLNNALASTQALSATDHPSFTLHYTMQDADGDLSPATLTITLNGADDRATVTTSAQGPDVIVYEHGLTSAPDTSETATNSFSFSVSDGLNTLTVGGTAFTLAQLQGASVATPLSVNTGEGTLLITGYAGNSFGGAVSYSYTLLAPINNTGGAANESFLDTVTVTVSGIGGTTANGTLNMSIIDDHPLASNDGPFAVTEDAVSNVVSGNVLDNDTANADTPKAFVGWSGADAATIATLNSYGTLVQGASGTWSFTLNNALASTQALSATDHPSFTLHYTMQDADGDLSPATLTITLNGADDRATVTTSAQGPDVIVYEHGLTSAPDTSETATNSFSFSVSDGLNTLTVGGTAFTLAQLQGASVATPLSVNTGEGTLLITGYAGNSFGGAVSYSYTLLAPINNTGGAANESFLDTVTVTVSGIGGTTANGTLNMSIIDDHPLASNDGPFAVTEDAVSNVVSGNVLDNDTANADTPKAFVGWSGADAATIATLNSYGTLVQGASGTWSFTLNNALASTQALSATDHPSFILHYTMQDADGDLSPATLTITLNGNNDNPSISFNSGSGTAIVSEEGLSNALMDNVLLNDPASPSSDPADAAGNPKTSQGSFIVSDIDLGDTLTVSLLATGLPNLTSNHVAVQWALSPDNHTLVGYVGTNTSANTVLTVTIEPDTTTTATNDWKYTVELFKPVDHPNNSYEDLLNFNVGVKVSDNHSGSSTANIAITIEDDMPVAPAAQTVAVNPPPTIATNLVLTLDVSGSMAWALDSDNAPTGGGMTRLALAKSALASLIDQYDSIGDVKVMLVTFSGSASVQGATTWLDVATAKSILAGLSTDSSTNYDVGLQQVLNRFGDSGKFTSGSFQNIAYFLSDGAPTDSGYLTYPSGETGNTSTVGIVGDDVLDWQAFLQANKINSLAYGMGSNSVQSTLDPIAYNGSTATPSDTNAVVVTALANLPAVLLDSVPLAAYAFNLMPSGGFGADGGHIASITVDGITYRFDGTVSGGTSRGTYDASTHVWTVNSNGTTSAGGTIVVDLDTGLGTYNVSPTSSLVETINYALVDNDGDGASSSITFNLNTPPTVTIDTGNPSNANDQVYEAAMASGTTPASNTEFANGTITLADTNGLGTLTNITINGVTVAINALVGASFNSANGVLTLTNYNSGTGVISYQFELKTPTTDVASSTESNSFSITASDGSLSSAPQTLTIDIVDDAPILAVTNGFIADQAGGYLLGTLVNFGADGPAASNPITWTSAAAKINGATETLTSLGEAITITQSGNITTGKTADNDTIFTVTANADGTYTMNLLRAIDTSKLFDTSDRLLSYGDGPSTGYTLSSGAGDQLVAYSSGTGVDPDSSSTVLANFSGTVNGTASQINMSTSGIGIANNNMDAGETLRIDLANSAHFAAVLLSVTNYSNGEGTYTVYYTDGTSSAVTPIVPGAGGDLLIQSPAGKFIDYLDISHPSGAGSGNSFKIDGMNFFTQDANRVPTLDLGFTAKDGDGDTVTGTVKITLDASDPVAGTTGNDALGGASLGDTLQGGNGNDILSGAAGNDTLSGGNGNDILNGGAGNDILNGGADSDVFVFSTVATNGVDTIEDFTVAAKASGGDVLDITDLLSGAGVSAQFAGNEGAFLQLVSDGLGNTKVMFDANGNTNNHTDAVQVATLNGVTGVDSATLLNQLLSNGEIQTHH